MGLLHNAEATARLPIICVALVTEISVRLAYKSENTSYLLVVKSLTVRQNMIKEGPNDIQRIHVYSAD